VTFPGPAPLARGLVVGPGGAVPPGWDDVLRVRVEDETAASALHRAWSGRRRVVVELAVDAAELKEPQTERRAPWQLGAGYDLATERLHFLVWANTYDGRDPDQPPVWWHGVKAARLEGARPAGPGAAGDVVLADGRPAWCDGGPRSPLAVDGTIVHRDSIDAGRLTVARHRPPSSALASDQLAAVAHPGGPARVLAPAGSGKTRVLTERVRHLVDDRGHEPDLVTAVAYNVKAADELRERTDGFRPVIRTLNSLGLWICQMAGRVEVLEERGARDLVSSLVNVRRRVNTDPVAPYLEALSAIRLGLIDPEQAESRFPDAAGVAAMFEEYRGRLAARRAVDFDEQVYRAVELCLAEPDIRARARAAARTLLVDEFQDLTPAHLLLLRLVAGPGAAVFGVGDDDQVIYGYAGADPGFLIDFERYFPGAASYELRVNYRCPPAVVGAARTLLGYNRRRVPKEIVPAPGRGEGEGRLDVRRVAVDDLVTAAGDAVTAWAAEGVAWSDMAVLARVNSVLLPVQVVLREAGVPYVPAVGVETLGRTGMAATLAYLRMALVPGAIARADVTATVRRPSRRIARNVLEMMTRRPRTSVADLRALGEWLQGDDADRVSAYADDLALLAEAAKGSSTAEVLRLIRNRVGLGGALDALDASRGSADRSAHGDDLWALEQVAHLHPDPATFEPWLRRSLAPETPAEDAVVLSTVHRVKGREWPRVIVFGASAELFPHRLADDEEEERRVFHVALTRARTAVIVLGDAAAPSPFLDELTGVAVLAAAGTRVLRTSPAAAGGGPSPSGPDSPLFHALRAWRTEVARRDGVPPYVVMNDAHLRGIAERRPATLVELSRCAGIGPVKLDRYGDDILAVLERETGPP
jgi:DNA helicase II / ATP-dependent DNA helicase PcrA